MRAGRTVNSSQNGEAQTGRGAVHGGTRQFRATGASGVGTQPNNTHRTGKTAPSRMNTVPSGVGDQNVRTPESFSDKVGKPAAEVVRGTLRGYRTVVEQKNIVREKGSPDYVFLVLVLVLIAFGTIMVYSASYAYANNVYGDSYHFIFRQIVFIIIGSIGMFLCYLITPRGYIMMTPLAYAVCVCAMIAVQIIGVEHGGAKRWINLGFTDLQPSEFMKLGLILLLACYINIHYEKITDKNNLGKASLYGVAGPLAITLITCLLVIIQKHLSGTIIMFSIGVIMIYVSGAPLRWLYIGAGVGGGAAALFSIITPYTRRRLDTWLHPENDPTDAGYQTLQGLYAIGSGGLFGEGLGNSYQKHHFVSQPQNDFIFTIICEELGYIGAMAVIALFVLLIWRGVRIAMKAPDVFSTMLVLGIIGKTALQVVLNIAVVTNSIPNTGISLPFFSYGGSALIVAMAEMGIVLSVSRFSKLQK